MQCNDLVRSFLKFLGLYIIHYTLKLRIHFLVGGNEEYWEESNE